MLIIKNQKTKQIIIASENRHLILNWIQDQIKSKANRIPDYFNKVTTKTDLIYNSIDSVKLLAEQIEDLDQLFKDVADCWNMKTLEVIPDLRFEVRTRYLIQTIDQKNLGII